MGRFCFERNRFKNVLVPFLFNVSGRLLRLVFFCRFGPNNKIVKGPRNQKILRDGFTKKGDLQDE